MADLAKREQPALIVAGSTAYARTIDPRPFREIADSVGALFMFDAAHPAGLIAGGAHPSPVGVADVVTLTTHKTLRGPRGGAILCGADLAKKIDSAVFPGLQGGPLEHVIAAKAVAFAEAARPEFRRYAADVVTNAAALGAAMVDEGFRLVSGGTDNHMILVDLRTFDEELTGREAQEVLDRAGITLNRNTIPDDPRSPFVTSGLRLGTAAETTAGMGPGEMQTIASLIGRTLRDRADEAEDRVRPGRGGRTVCRLPALSGPLDVARACRTSGWYGLVLVVAAGATAAFTVPARRLSLRVGYVAAPNERTMHKMPIPYGGGAAMFLGFLVAVLAAAAIPALRPVFVDSPEMLGVVLAAGAIFAVGLIDDVRDMSAPAKLAGQILAASILYFLGVTMYQFKVPLAGFIVLTPGIIPLITAAWVIALANAINLIDGLDGLAAGIVAIGGGALADLRHPPDGPGHPADWTTWARWWR